MNYDNFKQRCKDKGYSPSSLVTEIGINKSNITKWKNGSNPSYDTLIKMAEILECSVGFLLGTEIDGMSYGAKVNKGLRLMKTTPFRTISLVESAPIPDEELAGLSQFLNTSIQYLCSPEPKEYKPVDVNRQSLEQFDIPRYMDILIGLFDRVIADTFFAILQIQISKIVLYNLNITSADEINDKFLSDKINFILTNQKSDDSLANTGFNISDLICIGRMNGKSLKFMFTGIDN